MAVRNILLLSSFLAIVSAQYSATYSPDNLPNQSEQGQAGTNQCGTANSQSSECQTAHVNSIDSFCLWAPPKAGVTIGESERYEVAYCTDSGYGTRTIPEGTLTGVHYVQTPDYVQITGVGDLTKINVQKGDAGGELDPHGADGNGNPIGGLVFTDAFGVQGQQVHEWTSFISDTQFCIRICNPAGPLAADYCQHIYDTLGCEWNMPGNYASGFDQCLGNSTEPMGVYGTSTFWQGMPHTPQAHEMGATSSCTIFNGLKSGMPSMTAPGVSQATSSSSASASSASSSIPTAALAAAASPSDANNVVSSAVASHVCLLGALFASGLYAAFMIL